MKIRKCLILCIMLGLALPPTWAGQGWYLMFPPVKDNKALEPEKILDLKAPLSKWHQVDIYSSYDTAAECTAALQSMGDIRRDRWERISERFIETLRKNQDKAVSKLSASEKAVLEDMRARQEAALVDYTVSGYARCIASDDPRLK